MCNAKRKCADRARDIVNAICMEAGDGFGSTPTGVPRDLPSLTDSDLGWAVIEAMLDACSPVALDRIVAMADARR